MGHLLPHAGMGKRLAAAAAPPCLLGGCVLCEKGPPVLTMLRPVEGVLASMGRSRSSGLGEAASAPPGRWGPLAGSIFREPSEPQAQTTGVVGKGMRQQGCREA